MIIGFANEKGSYGTRMIRRWRIRTDLTDLTQIWQDKKWWS